MNYHIHDVCFKQNTQFQGTWLERHIHVGGGVQNSFGDWSMGNVCGIIGFQQCMEWIRELGSKILFIKNVFAFWRLIYHFLILLMVFCKFWKMLAIVVFLLPYTSTKMCWWSDMHRSSRFYLRWWSSWFLYHLLCWMELRSIKASTGVALHCWFA